MAFSTLVVDLQLIYNESPYLFLGKVNNRDYLDNYERHVSILNDLNGLNITLGIIHSLKQKCYACFHPLQCTGIDDRTPI